MLAMLVHVRIRICFTNGFEYTRASLDRATQRCRAATVMSNPTFFVEVVIVTATTSISVIVIIVAVEGGFRVD